MDKKNAGSMRDAMPKVAAFVDELREAFGAEEVNGWIRDGIRHGGFYAEEAGHTVGIKPRAPDPDKVFSGDRLVISTRHE